MNYAPLVLAVSLVSVTAADAGTQLSVPFVANQGQFDSRVAFRASTHFGALFVTRDGALVYALAGREAPGPVVERFVGARTVAPAGERPARARVSTFVGRDPKRWRRDLPTFDRVALGELWPGVDVALAARGDDTEKLFTLRPGARVESIRVALAGTGALHLGGDGALLAASAGAPLRFSPPLAFQDIGGERRRVEVAYALRGEREYGFSLGAHDARHPVVIDPVLQSSFLGGSGADSVFGMRIHPGSGEVYVFGSTTSMDFPGTAGGPQPAYGGSALGMGFIARVAGDLTAAGGGLLQATYFGTDGSDSQTTSVNAIAFHSGGDVFMTGTTSSSFIPGTSTGALPSALGSQDGFVARLSADLTTLVTASYYGDNTSQISDAIVLSADEQRVYIAGQSGATGALPNTAGAVQPTPGGGLGETFLAIFSPDLASIERSTYHGGNQGNERVEELLVDPVNDDLIITVSSSSPNFPMPGNGAIQTKPDPSFSMQATVARFSADLTARPVATWFGGSAGTAGPHGMALDPVSGDIYLLGGTDDATLPATGFQPSHGGGTFDTFIARFSGDLSVLRGATYFGGTGDQAQADLTRHVLVHPVNGDLYIAGKTNSADLPGLAGANQETLAFPSFGDGVLARISPDLGTLVQATYFGDPSGGTSEIATIAVNADASEIYIVGNSAATDLAALAGGAQTAPATAFLARMDFTLTQAGPAGGGGVTLEAVAKGTALAAPVLAVLLLVVARRGRGTRD